MDVVCYPSISYTSLYSYNSLSLIVNSNCLLCCLDSTRKVYIRKLQRLARDVQESEAPVEAVDDESEEEEEVRPAARPARPMTAKTRSSPQKTPPPAAGYVKCLVLILW